jgi:molybdenum cofactor cytidylyltransferase
MISAIILAAGASQRMGRPKQLLPVAGVPMLVRAVDAVLRAQLDQVIVVLGSSAGVISPVLAGKPVTAVINEEWQEGIASSIRAGLAQVVEASQAALFVPADLPYLAPATIDAVCSHYLASGKPIVIPTCRGQRGNPALFARALFPELQALHGDRGGRVLFGAHQDDIAMIEVGDEGILVDVDTLDDYGRVQGRG